MTTWLDNFISDAAPTAPKRSGYKVIREAMEWLRTTDAVQDGVPYSARNLREAFGKNQIFASGEETSTTLLSLCKKACAAGWMSSNGGTSQAARYTLNRMPPKAVPPIPAEPPWEEPQPAWAVRLEMKIDRALKILEALA